MDVIEQKPSMLTESRNDRITDILKTGYPPKTIFCGEYKEAFYVFICALYDAENTSVFLFLVPSIHCSLLVPCTVCLRVSEYFTPVHIAGRS